MKEQNAVGPTEKELKSRLKEHMDFHKRSESIVMLWRGYLGALVEFGLIAPGVYSDVSRLLPEDVGLAALDELMGGLPSENEDHPANKPSLPSASG